MTSTLSAPTLAEVEEAVDRHGISTCTIVDVLDGLGAASSVLHSSMRRLSGGDRMFIGAAYPVNWVVVRKGPRITEQSPSTWHQVRDFIVPEVTDGRGLVYVAGAGALVTEAALLGGLSLTYLSQVLGFAGVVLGGAIRDRGVVEAVNCPVVATNYIPTDTQGAYRVESVGRDCMIDHVIVRAGDWVFSDGNGTVVVPAPLLGEVLARAAEVERTESAILDRLRLGERLPEIIDAVGRI